MKAVETHLSIETILNVRDLWLFVEDEKLVFVC